MKHANKQLKQSLADLARLLNKGIEAKLLDLPAADELKRSTIDAVAHDSPKGQR
ncbi:hypothetical protein SAMN05216412_10754 [Nitrosospira multiformis]|uniref:Uncharacterized protein n=1 Tax=Nitrosospira multiformis TaxID=1231 RepID=A0A1I0ERG5_9PROT|nr:hypothetical protein SAMN05216412_10754 [Nitrosospira multiformis]